MTRQREDVLCLHYTTLIAALEHARYQGADGRLVHRLAGEVPSAALLQRSEVDVARNPRFQVITRGMVPSRT